MAVTVVGLVATFGMNFNVLVPPLARRCSTATPSGYGFLMTASGVGALVAAVILVLSAASHGRGRIGSGAILLGVATIALSGSTRRSRVRSCSWCSSGSAASRWRPPRTPPSSSRPGRAARPGDERLHDGLQRLGPDRWHRHRRSSPRRRHPRHHGDRRGLSLATGIGAAIWWRRMQVADRTTPASEHAMGLQAGRAGR